MLLSLPLAAFLPTEASLAPLSPLTVEEEMTGYFPFALPLWLWLLTFAGETLPLLLLPLPPLWVPVEEVPDVGKGLIAVRLPLQMVAQLLHRLSAESLHGRQLALLHLLGQAPLFLGALSLVRGDPPCIPRVKGYPGAPLRLL